MKRILPIILSAIVLLSLAGCDNKDESANILYDMGIGLTVKMDMLAENDNYNAMFAPELKTAAKKISSSDYTKPKMVFEIGGIDELVIPHYIKENVSFPEDIEKFVKKRLILSLPQQINAHNGVEMVAVSSCITVNDSFLYEGMTESKLYLYIYEGDYNSLVTFTPNSENIIEASANFVSDEKLKKISSEFDVKTFFSETINMNNITVKEIPLR